MDTITREKWNRKHEDFKTVIDGTPYVLKLDPETGATVLVPVRIIDTESTGTGYETEGYTLHARRGTGAELGVPVSRERAARLIRHSCGTFRKDRPPFGRLHCRLLELEPKAYKELDGPYDRAPVMMLRVLRRRTG